MAAPGPWREPAPYPSYPRGRPHSPPKPGRVLHHPYAAAAAAPQRHSFYAPPAPPHAIPGFYNPALAQTHHPSLIPGGGSHTNAPTFPEPRFGPGLPASLVPGRQPTSAAPRSQSNDLFFQQNDPLALPSHPFRHAQSYYAPPLPRKPDFDQPPLPPKPSLSLPHSPPLSPYSDPGPSSTRTTQFNSPYNSPEPLPTPASAPAPSTTSLPSPNQYDQDEDDIFNRVLQMSAQEARQSPQGPGLSEEEQITRALEESLRINPSQHVSPVRPYPAMTSSPEQGPSVPPVNSNSVMPIPDLDLGIGNGASSSRPPSDRYDARPRWADQISADEALARQLAEEEERMMKEDEEEERRRAGPEPPRKSPSLSLGNATSSSSVVSSPVANVPSAAVPTPSGSPVDGPPQYDDAISSPPPASGAFYSSSLSAHFAANGATATGAGPSTSRPGSPSRMPTLGRSISDRPVPPKSYTPPDQMRPLGRSQSLAESAPTVSTSLLIPPTPTSAGRPLSIASSELDSVEESNPTSPVSAVPNSADFVSQTQYLDQELLMGLTMGFGTPPITPAVKPFDGVIPNVIALPYGRSPPFHIRATSWRTLLKLLARLGSSRLEPTMEAMAVVKTEMRLRVVVSFVKVHHASSDWHTVLYMTIDHPVPPNAPTGWKYRNGDTNTLPWSYTLSPLPAYLRDGAEAPLSKFYAIPTLNEAPFPVLPISFPNLATYLASALESSRNAMNDSSSGVRRLARCIDQLYPSDHIGVLDDAPEKAGVRQRLKNLVGIGSRPQRDRNADVYELVTPFVPDQYGH